VWPFSFSDGVAKPLMRGFMGDRPFVRPSAAKWSIGVEDRAGILHPTVPRRRLHVRQLFVGVFADEARE
jgi:hypothetical protein